MQKANSKIVKLVSGGLDSFILSQEYEGLNIYIDFGQRYAAAEKEALDKLNVKYEVVKINSSYNPQENIYIPNRNLSLCALVSMLYDPNIIMLAGLKDDNCIDKNEVEFGLMSQLLTRYANHEVKVISPYWKTTKGELVANYKGNKEDLNNTFSCYNPTKEGKPCGKCPACLRRAIALETNGIKCNVDIDESIINEYLAKIHTYEADRISRFFIFLKKRKPVYAIDIDGILCEDNGQYKYRKPKQFLMPQNGYIVLYTARLESDRELTERWLKENGIKYDALLTNKLPYSFLVDDNASEQWKG